MIQLWTWEDIEGTALLLISEEIEVLWEEEYNLVNSFTDWQLLSWILYFPFQRRREMWYKQLFNYQPEQQGFNLSLHTAAALTLWRHFWLICWGFTGDDEIRVQTYSMVLWKTIVHISKCNAAISNLITVNKQLYSGGKGGRSSGLIISFPESGQAHFGTQRKEKQDKIIPLMPVLQTQFCSFCVLRKLTPKEVFPTLPLSFPQFICRQNPLFSLLK